MLSAYTLPGSFNIDSVRFIYFEENDAIVLREISEILTTPGADVYLTLFTDDKAIIFNNNTSRYLAVLIGLMWLDFVISSTQLLCPPGGKLAYPVVDEPTVDEDVKLIANFVALNDNYELNCVSNIVIDNISYTAVPYSGLSATEAIPMNAVNPSRLDISELTLAEGTTTDDAGSYCYLLEVSEAIKIRGLATVIEN